MATYPNARRNKLTDTLYRPNDVKPLDGDVLTDDGADSKVEQKVAELKKMLGRAAQERGNIMSDADKASADTINAATTIRTPARDPINEALMKSGPIAVPFNRQPQRDANLQRRVDETKYQFANPRDQGNSPLGNVPAELRPNTQFINNAPVPPTLNRVAPVEPMPAKPNGNDAAYLAALGITGSDNYKPAASPSPVVPPNNLRMPPITPPSVAVYTPNVVDQNKSIEMNKSLRADATVGTSDNAVSQDPSVVSPRKRIAANPAMPVDAVPADANPVRREMADAMPAAPNHRYRPGERAGADPITGEGNGGSVPAWTKRSEMPGAAGRQLADMVNPNPTNRSPEDQGIIDVFGQDAWANGMQADGKVKPVGPNPIIAQGDAAVAAANTARQGKVSGGADASLTAPATTTEEQRALARVEQKFGPVTQQPSPPPAPKEQLAPVAEPPVAPKPTGTDPNELKRRFAEDRATVEDTVNAPRLPTAIPEGSQPDPNPLDTARRNQAYFDRLVASGAPADEIARARQQMDQSRNIASGYRTYGFRTSETPEQSAAINRQLAAASQPLDPAGSFNTGAEQAKWDALRGSMGNDELARADRDAKFMEQVKNGPQSQEETYARINMQREAAGLPPVAIPTSQETYTAQKQATDNKASVANANQAEGLRRQQQNAAADANYTAQRAAQGKSRRLGIPPAAAAMFDPTAKPGTPAYDANMALINPAVAIEQQRMRGIDTAANTAAENRRREDLNNQFKAQTAMIDAKLADPTVPESEKKNLRMQREQLTNAYIASLNPRGNLPTPRPDAPNASNTVPPGGNAVPGVPTPPLAPSPPAAVPPAIPPGSVTSGLNIASNDPADINAAIAAYRPNNADFWNAERDNWSVLPAMGNAHSNVYVPPSTSYQDTDGVPGPSAGDQYANPHDRAALLGQAKAKQAIDTIMSEIPNINNNWGPESPDSIAKALMAKYGNQYGEDAVRWAVAKWMKDSGMLFTNRDAPKVVTDDGYWQNLIR